MTNWQELRDYLSWVEERPDGMPLQADTKWNKYVRAQRLVRLISQGRPTEGARALRNGIIALAQQHRLSVFRAFRLMRRLVHINAVYEVETAFQRAPVPSAVSKSLSRIRASIGRIADFANSESPSDRHALDFLQRALTRVARELPTQQQQALGIEFEIVTVADRQFSSDNLPTLLNRWFSLARVVEEAVASEMQRQTVKSDNDLAFSKGEWTGPVLIESVTPIVKLIGGTLPEFYQLVSGREFTRSRFTIAPAKNPTKEGLQATEGTIFVLACLDLMKLGPYSAETVSKYRSEFLAAQKAGRIK